MKDVNGYYVYAYLDTCKPGQFNYSLGSFLLEPFYIGKGYGKRQVKHLTDKKMSPKTKRIASIKEAGQNPTIIRLASGLTEAAALEIEREWIAVIGRSVTGDGPLTNITAGGQGVSGLILSSESRQKIREKLKGRPLPESTKQKMKGRKVWNKGIPLAEGTKAKLRETMTGRTITERQKECLRLGVLHTRGRKLSPEMYEKAKATMFKKGQPSTKKGVKWTEGQKRKLAETRARNPITEETRQKMRASRLAYLASQRSDQ